jgi:hypothetical protein
MGQCPLKKRGEGGSLAADPTPTLRGAPQQSHACRAWSRIGRLIHARPLTRMLSADRSHGRFSFFGNSIHPSAAIPNRRS